MISQRNKKRHVMHAMPVCSTYNTDILYQIFSFAVEWKLLTFRASDDFPSNVWTKKLYYMKLEAALTGRQYITESIIKL